MAARKQSNFVIGQLNSHDYYTLYTHPQSHSIPMIYKVESYYKNHRPIKRLAFKYVCTRKLSPEGRPSLGFSLSFCFVVVSPPHSRVIRAFIYHCSCVFTERERETLSRATRSLNSDSAIQRDLLNDEASRALAKNKSITAAA